MLIHGAVSGAHASWTQLRTRLPGWTLVAPNRRGYHPRTPTDSEDYEADACDVLDLLREPAHVVGHSYGAVVALVAAARAPKLILSLTLAEPPPLPGTHGLAFVREWIERATALRNRGPGDPREFLGQFLSLVGGPGEAMAHVDQVHQQLRLLRSSRPAWTAQPAVAALVASARPTLVVSGGHSPVFEAAAGYLASLLNGRHIVLPAAGHFVQQDPRFAPVLDAFLRKAEAANHLI